MGLRHHEGFLLAVGHYQELDCFLPETAFFAVVGDDGGDGGGGALVPEYFFRFVEVVEVAEVDAYDIFPGFGVLIGLLCFLVSAF